MNITLTADSELNNRGYWRGDVFYADLGKRIGSEQSGYRPVLIVQNNTGNRYAPTVIVAPITSRSKKKSLPTHVQLEGVPGMEKAIPSQILLEQLMTIDKCCIHRYVGHIDDNMQRAVDSAIRCSLSI